MTTRRRTLAPILALVPLAACWALALPGCATQPGSGSTEAAEQATSGDIVTLPAGNAVDLAKKSVAGKVTIFDFYAEWCSPCKLIGPELERLAASRPDEVALRKIDVIGWGSEAAIQQKIEYLPYLAVVGPDGKVAAVGDESFDYLKQKFDVDLTALLTG